VRTRTPDQIIDRWLRDELDAVPEPARAVSDAVNAAAVTPQRRGRLHRLRRLLGMDGARVDHGRHDRPEVVLMPSVGSGGLADPGVVRREGSVPLVAVLAVLLTAAVVVGASAWLTVGPGRELIGGSSEQGTTTPEQPMRPLDPPGPDRVIVVDPADGHFSTIAGAVAAAVPGDRIELHPGTYQAEVVITADITITGVGDRTEVIVEPLPLPPGGDVRDRMRDVFTLRGSDATLRGFTLRGSSNGTAIHVDGGSPLIEDLVIDPDGDMRTGGPSQPREAIVATGGSSPIIRDSLLRSLAAFDGGATPLIEDTVMEASCLLIEGTGTAPTVRNVTFQGSECPGFSISVAKGASAEIVANHIYSLDENAGIRAANEGTHVAISGTDISGGREGILVSFGAEATAHRSMVTGAEVGVRLVDATLDLQLGRLEDNGIGLQVSGDSYLETSGMDVCDNGRNLELRDGAMVPYDQNRVCLDGTSELATEAGA
jgi:hypothetical protein